jgi:hypothetical protein
MFVADLSYRERKRVGEVCRRINIRKVLQVFHAYFIGRIAGRDYLVEHIVNGVIIREVRWVCSVKLCQ